MKIKRYAFDIISKTDEYCRSTDAAAIEKIVEAGDAVRDYLRDFFTPGHYAEADMLIAAYDAAKNAQRGEAAVGKEGE